MPFLDGPDPDRSEPPLSSPSPTNSADSGDQEEATPFIISQQILDHLNSVGWDICEYLTQAQDRSLCEGLGESWWHLKQEISPYITTLIASYSPDPEERCSNDPRWLYGGEPEELVAALADIAATDLTKLIGENRLSEEQLARLGNRGHISQLFLDFISTIPQSGAESDAGTPVGWIPQLTNEYCAQVCQLVKSSASYLSHPGGKDWLEKVATDADPAKYPNPLDATLYLVKKYRAALKHELKLSAA